MAVAGSSITRTVDAAGDKVLTFKDGTSLEHAQGVAIVDKSHAQVGVTGAPLVVDGSATTQPVSALSTALLVDGSATTQPVSALSTALLVDGSATTQPVSALSTALLVDGSAVTQPISIAAANLRDYLLEAGKGAITGVLCVDKFGRNPDVDTASDPEDVWDAGGLWVPPTTARLHDLASSDANDTLAGTGAQKVTVEGLDASYAEQSEEVDMAGASNAPTVNTYTRIFRAYVTQAGSGLVNAGDITVTAQTDATVTAQISAGFGQTLMAIYTVPAGKTAFMLHSYANLNKSGSSSSLDVALRSRGPIDVATSAWRTKLFLGLISTGGSHMQHVFKPYKKFTEKTDIVIRVVETSANNADVSAGFGLLVITN